MNTQEMICIGCPMGCELTVTEKNGAYSVSGNQCKIGEKYGVEEMTNPTRNIASSVPVRYGDVKMLSVKTKSPVPKRAIAACMAAVKQVTAQAPVRVGDVILADVAGTGVDMVATRPVNFTGQ